MTWATKEADMGLKTSAREQFGLLNFMPARFDDASTFSNAGNNAVFFLVYSSNARTIPTVIALISPPALAVVLS